MIINFRKDYNTLVCMFCGDQEELTVPPITKEAHCQKSLGCDCIRRKWKQRLEARQLRAEPHYPEFGSTHARYETYADWPRQIVQHPAVLSDAGLFYIRMSDVVKCFHCGGALHSWEKDDDPLEEHRKYFPNCLYALSVSATRPA